MAHMSAVTGIWVYWCPQAFGATVKACLQDEGSALSLELAWK